MCSNQQQQQQQDPSSSERTMIDTVIEIAKMKKEEREIWKLNLDWSEVKPN